MSRARQTSLPVPAGTPPQPLATAPAASVYAAPAAPQAAPQYPQPQMLPQAFPVAYTPPVEAPVYDYESKPPEPRTNYAPNSDAAPVYNMPAQVVLIPAPQASVISPPVPRFPYLESIRPEQPVPEVAYPTTGHGASFLHTLDMSGSGDFQVLPEQTDIEAEIIKADIGTAKSGSGNPVLNLQLRVTFPMAYANCPIYDNIALVKEMAGKYKSLFRSCEDAEGRPLLTPDGARFNGKDENDLLGNVVKFRVRNGISPNGNPRNEIIGSYSMATNSEGMEGAVPINANGPQAPQLAQGPPPASNVKW